jgi:hypothetical protein
VVVPKSDIFVVMLGIALGAIVLGIILMLGVLWRHDFSVTVSSLQGMPLPASSGFSSPGKSSIG